MNADNRNPDKITIKVRHSDEDYHEITIDWSNESFDYRKQLFHQLSAYTGIPVEHQEYVGVEHGSNRSGGLTNTEFKDGRYNAGYDWQYWQYESKERTRNTFQDGDCFLFRTRIFADGSGLICRYELSHQSLVNAAECNRHYCHYLGRRYFTKKFAVYIKSNELQTISSQRVQSLEELHRVQLSLNIVHIMEPVCTGRILAWPDHFPFHVNQMYLRYRG
ncbi:uncharacterized protein LOC107368053 [Tetranychus urticae]|uniref:uncharacterized protein LOC107368053 n=1 Tax=Tetranychus urticae TaxID=32264 RepID=UPI00077BBA1B|nr:uncharacterized protein LOC107368053 [Tetranychus urticae]